MSKLDYCWLLFAGITYLLGSIGLYTTSCNHFMQYIIPLIFWVITWFSFGFFKRGFEINSKKQIELKCRQEEFKAELRHTHTINELRKAIDSIYEEYEGHDLVEKDDIMDRFEQIINDYYER